MTQQKQSLIRSFGYAFKGMGVMVKERNFLIQIAIGTVVIGLAWLGEMSNVEKAIIVLATALVLGMESLNSALERLLDFICPQENPEVEKIKDVAAGVVLTFAAAAVAVGAILFGGVILE